MRSWRIVSDLRLLFIHGTSGHKKPKTWLGPLNRALEQFGIEPICESDLPDVNYKPLLSRSADGGSDNGKRRTKLGREIRIAYGNTQTELAKRLAKFNEAPPRLGLGHLPDRIRKWGAKHARAKAFRKTAEAYRARRIRVCNYVLETAGPGDFIVIGYSLGSVVAADLLGRLRDDQHIRLLVTIGSPLGAGAWDKTWNTLRPFPYDKVDAWVNIYNQWDPVTMGVGLGRRDVVDVRIGTFPSPGFKLTRSRLKKIAFAQHKVGRYTGHPVVASAVAWALEAG